MARKKPELILKRAKDRWKTKKQWHTLWEDAYELTMPHRNPFHEVQEGSVKTDRVYDAQPVNSARRFAARMQTELTPPFEEWFELTTGPTIPNDRESEVRGILQQVANIATQVFNTGNFNAAIHEVYEDLGIGTGVMLILEGDDRSNPVRFVSVPQHRVAIGEGPYGRVDSIYRKHEMRARDVEKRWPDMDVPSDISEKANDKDDEDDEFELWETTYRGKQTVDVTNDRGEKIGEEEETIWYYDIIWEGGEKKSEPERLLEREYEINPWVVVRWNKLPEENRGRGPIITALPDIKTLNKAKELILKNASLAISAPLMVADDGVTSPDNIRIAPAALIPVARNAGPNGPSIEPLETARNFDVSQLILDDLRVAIKKMMFDNQLPPPQGETPRSATEIIERMQELAQDIGGSFGRLYLELITPMVQRVIQILFKKGFINTDVNINNLAVQLQVTSPLARTQNLNDVQNIVQWMQIIANFGGPQGLALSTKAERVFNHIGEKLGVPQDLMRTEQERQQLTQRIAQLAQRGQAQNLARQTPQEEIQRNVEENLPIEEAA